MEMKISFPDGNRVDADFNGFKVPTDQALESGEPGSAPEPYDLFVASLGTCAGIYALSFCQERKLSTEGLAIDVSAEKDEKSHLFTQITMEIALPADFPERYRKAICRTAGLCTVKRSLASPPTFDIRTKPA
ncbi:MAG: OsmC family protein [Desulfosarcinaceae bacterium]|jgi:ribosomal protein S12 methylthiotransferase accessory factor